MGTFSYLYPVYVDGKKYTAVTIGGLGLNAIADKNQLQAYINSLSKLSDDLLGIEVDLTAHPFSTGQTELIDSIKNRKAGELHPLVNRKAFIEHLSKLRNGAEKYLEEGHV
ncbi:hypothetical protein [Turicimonas muris]